jgi:sulfoxide reductase catalytic subunit YedY
VVKRYTPNIPSERITPPEVFFNRRTFMTAFGTGMLATPLAMCTSTTGAEAQPQGSILEIPFARPNVFPAERNTVYGIPAAIARKDMMAREAAGSHNNFYEFLSGRGGPVWQFIDDFEVEPWKIEVTGECNNPFTLDLDDLFAFPHEERTYHFRCVERWAMNVPWSGFPLSALIEKAQPTADARYLKFVTARVPDQMPGLRESPWYPWPYTEALRMDEAMNELAFLVTGVYGEPLPKQHGSPVRIVVPWKYGYKNPKSIVTIEFVRDEPQTFWQVQPHEYGFLSNINPNIPHPRWPQDVSYWLDTEESFATPFFNGYADFVAELYPDEPTTPQRALRAGDTAR